MSKHWVPEDDTAGSGRPAIDDDTEGHVLRQDQQPGAKAEEQPNFRVAQDEDDAGSPGVKV